MKVPKTNAMRMLDTAKVPYQVHTYTSEDGAIDGVSVAQKLGQDIKQVYKTLVTQGAGKNYFVFVIPVAKELDLKAAARAVGEKNVQMIPVADINKVTGYIRGGCSPVGMKKLFTTVMDTSAFSQPFICVSGGKIGIQIQLDPAALRDLIHAKTADITTGEDE